MKKRFRSVSRKKKKDRLGYLIISLSLTALACIAALFIYAKSNNTKNDPVTMCSDNGPAGKTVVLIDRTDLLSELQKQELIVYINDLKNDIPVGSSISIYGISKPSLDKISPEIYICNPGMGDDKSPWIANPELIKNNWITNFSDKLNNIMKEMMKPLELPTSPLMEALKAVSVNEFIGKQNENIPKKIILISDMLQNTTVYSQYTQELDFEKFEKTDTFKQYMPDLTGVDMEILYIRRTTARHIQGKKHILFWQSYINKSGGIISKVQSIN